MSEQGTCSRGDLCRFAHNIRELRATVQSSQNSSFGSRNSSFGGQNSSFGGQNSSFGGQNSSFGGQNNTFGGQNRELSSQNSIFGGQNNAFGGLKRKQEIGSYQQTVKNCNFLFFSIRGLHFQRAK